MLHKQLEAAVSSKIELEALLVEVHEQKESVEDRHESILGNHQELTAQVADLEHNLSMVADQHSKTMEAHGSLEIQMAEMKQQHEMQLEKSAADLFKQRKETGYNTFYGTSFSMCELKTFSAYIFCWYTR